MTQNDILGSTMFKDTIAYGGWPLDLHPPEGIDAPDLEPCVQHPVPYLYDIPLRACVSKTISNLMFAGRNISATHVAFASTRVMATCGVIGQGVGTAAAIAIQQEQLPASLASSPPSLRAIQQRLLRDDCFLLALQNEDKEDLAKQARITASSEQQGAIAAQVAQGQTRCVHGDKGVSSERREATSQRWMSDPADPLPATLELEWDEGIELREVQLIFDTGLHRHLTLSHHDGYTASMHWGEAQPETVRDYTLSGYDGTNGFPLLEVNGNYKRRRVHRLSPSVLIQKLRITVNATNGIDHARIVEVRAYA